MLLGLLQSASLLALTGYLFYTRNRLHRRNLESWESLVAQLNLHSADHGVAAQAPWTDPALWMESGLIGENLWQPAHDLRGHWALLQNARIALEMADFVDRNAPSELTAAHLQSIRHLRQDAMQIRLRSLLALPRHAFSF
jgi:hypothetical protein